MTNGEIGTICGAILTGLTGIGGIVRWAATRIANAIESGNKERHDVIERNTTALIGVTGAVAEMKGLVTQARDASVTTQKAVEDVADEVTGSHELIPVEVIDEDELRLQQPPPFAKRVTPIGGYPAATSNKRKGRS